MIAVGIVAHHSRSEQAKQLTKTVGADFISIDNGTLGCDENHHLVQYHLSHLRSDWSVVLEDDAEPVPNFRHQATQALLAAPAPIVSFYLGRRKPSHYQPRIAKALTTAGETEACWIIATHMLHAVGYAIKTPLLPSLLEHHSDQPSDQHIASWARLHGHTIAYTVPSLVNHSDGPTLFDHPDGQPRRPGRRAWIVGERDEWSSQPVVSLTR